MSSITKTMKLHIHPDAVSDALFRELTERYSCACNEFSRYVFGNGFPLNFMVLQDKLYHMIRDKHGLKSQMAISAFKTVTARYKTVKEQLFQNPYRYKDSDVKWKYITRTLEWLLKPVCYRSNDDRVGAMNIYTLGTMYVSGDTNPKFGPCK